MPDFAACKSIEQEGGLTSARLDAEAGKRVSPDAPSKLDAAAPEKRRKIEGGAAVVAEQENGAATEEEGGKPDEAAFWSSLEATPAEPPLKVSDHFSPLLPLGGLCHK
jgi:hypothetical protein